MRINEDMRFLRVIFLLPLLGLSSCSYLLGNAAKMGMLDKALKKNNRTRHIPVHFISAADRSLDTLKQGAIGYLRKPVSKESPEKNELLLARA